VALAIIGEGKEARAMAKVEFDPNRSALSDCMALIEKAVEEAGFQTQGRVVTSRDDGMTELRKRLATTNVPGGFRKWQLPFILNGPATLFITVAEADARVPPHAHQEGDGIRFIAGGSINYEGTELSQGDWMFIPAGVEYSFEVGPNGAIMCYCYCCCCA
jgi:hypothetical protein